MNKTPTRVLLTLALLFIGFSLTAATAQAQWTTMDDAAPIVFDDDLLERICNAEGYEEPVPAKAKTYEPKPYVRTLSGIKMDDPKVPVGAVLTLYQEDDNREVYRWEEPLEGGFFLQHIDFGGIYVSRAKGRCQLGDGSCDVFPGDRFTVRRYIDADRDGLADEVVLIGYHEWSDNDLRTFKVRDAYAAWLLENNLAHLEPDSDYMVKNFMVDGKPAQPGPTHMTFYVNPDGSDVVGVLEDGTLVRDSNPPLVKPGDSFAFSKYRYSGRVGEMQPDELSEFMRYAYPRWAYDGYIPHSLKKDSGFRSTSDTSWELMPERLGFVEDTPREGLTPNGYKVYIDRSRGHTQTTLPMPTHGWEPVDSVRAGTNDYVVTEGSRETWTENKPFFLLNGEPDQYSAIPSHWTDYGTVIMLAPSDKPHEDFDWRKVILMRAELKDGQIQLYRAIWSTEEATE